MKIPLLPLHIITSGTLEREKQQRQEKEKTDAALTSALLRRIERLEGLLIRNRIQFHQVRVGSLN
jgi:hypothetical protein